MRTIEYRGYTIHRTGRMACDYCVAFPGRIRWGTVAELKADIDAYIEGWLPPPMRGYA